MRDVSAFQTLQRWCSNELINTVRMHKACIDLHKLEGASVLRKRCRHGPHPQARISLRLILLGKEKISCLQWSLTGHLLHFREDTIPNSSWSIQNYLNGILENFCFTLFVWAFFSYWTLFWFSFCGLIFFLFCFFFFFKEREEVYKVWRVGRSEVSEKNCGRRNMVNVYYMKKYFQ